MWCESHQETETFVTCIRCEKPICYRCQVQAPVGIRCVVCAKPVQLPLYTVSSAGHFRSAVVAVFAGVVLGIVLRFLAIGLTFLLFSLLGLLLVGVGLGYLMAEIVSRSAYNKRSKGLQLISGTGVLIAAFVGLGMLTIDYPGIILLVVAEFVTISRLR